MADHRRVKRLFLAAREVAAEERDAWLAEACDGDVGLRREVESMLAAEEGMPSGYLAPVWGSGFAPGSTVSHYRIVERLGAGGMGEVWLAHDETLDRRVALKFPSPALLGDPSVRQRLQREARAAAALEHPAVCRVFEVGQSDGQDFIAMEYVEGLPVDRYCDEHRSTVEERLALFIQIAQAVQAAHRALVVHRDLKPSNILITAEGSPMLLDFGIAKVLDPAVGAATTRTLLMLTPDYASPEQVRGAPVTTASDVYQLGLLLYELLTGVRAQRVANRSATELERIVVEQTPPPPSMAARTGDAAAERAEARRTTAPELARRLSGDLDAIVLQALRKEPERRYASAAEMAEDARRHLVALPVTARRDSLPYRAHKFVRRHTLGVTTAAGVLALTTTLVASYTVRVQQERDRALFEADKAARVSELLTDLFSGADPYVVTTREPSVRELLDAGARRIRTELHQQPELRATMLTTVGGIYVRLGAFGPARELLEEAVAVFESRVPENRMGLVEALTALATVYGEEAKFDRERPLLERALAIRNAIHGQGHVAVSDGLSALGDTYKRAGRLDEAERFHREALAIRRRQLGDRSLGVAESIHALGILQQHRGYFDEALASHREELRIYRYLQPHDHPSVANALNSIGATLGESGKPAEAAPYFAQALEIRQRLFGDNHPHTAMTLHNLGLSYVELGRYAAAQRLLNRARAAWTELFGERHAEVARCMFSLGRLHLEKEEFEEAEQQFREGISLWSETKGEMYPELAGPIDSLVRLLQETDQVAEARLYAEWALAIREQAYGPDHPDVVTRREALEAM